MSDQPTGCLKFVRLAVLAIGIGSTLTSCVVYDPMLPYGYAPPYGYVTPPGYYAPGYVYPAPPYFGSLNFSVGSGWGHGGWGHGGWGHGGWGHGGWGHGGWDRRHWH